MAESEAERIRNKRLAKLGAASSNPVANVYTDGQQDAPKDSSTTSILPPQSQHINPSTKLDITNTRAVNEKSTTTTPPKINITSNKTTNKGTSIDPNRHDHGFTEDRQLRQIFRISLQNDQIKDSSGIRFFHVASLAQELEQANEPRVLTVEHLDQALTEAGTLANAAGEDVFGYLLGCWKRVCKAVRGLKSSELDGPKADGLKEARRLCLSYAVFACTMPEMFDALPKEDNPIAVHLLKEPESEFGIDADFLAEISSRFEEDESYSEVITLAIQQLSTILGTMTMNDHYKPYMTALRSLVRYPKIVVAITEMDRFVPKNESAPAIEHQTILGPWFHLSPIHPKVAENYFSSPKTRDRGYISNAQQSLRMTLRTHQGELFEITNAIIKTAKEPREKLLDWFALVLNANHKRRGLQVDPATVSSDGFMLNITAVLDTLCDPFVDAAFSKIDRVDIDYLRRRPRVSVRDETKLNADLKQSDAFYDQQLSGDNNFISELFFMTVAAHHYGSEGVSSRLTELQKTLKHMEKELERFEGERTKYLSQPRLLAVFDQRAKEFKDRIDTVHSLVYAKQGALLDDLFQARSMQFMRFVIVWVLGIASGKKLANEKLTLPLPTEVPTAFKCLPEYFLEDIVDNFKFITRHMPHIVTTTQTEELIQVCITFLACPQYIKNPYLKQGLVSILCNGVVATHTSPRGVLTDMLNGMEFCHKHLLHALMRFYVDCEMTGAHTQFYDKFNIRSEINLVIQSIWSNVLYQNRLAQEADSNTDFFVQFVNLLLNDVTYVLDESFSSFHKIHDLTSELKSSSSKLDETSRKQKEELLEDTKDKAKSYMRLTVETISMLKLFTKALAGAFTKPEIVQRLADMLDYNVDALTGPKSSNLKVENPESYGFYPRQLLSEIMDVYLNLSSKLAFHKAIARDGRSYKPANFERMTDLMKRTIMKSPEELSAWSQLQKSIADAHKLDQEEEEDLGDIPDELLDPIMGSLMEDPVILPSSKQIVDRSTIRSHLLSDPTDPFNRVALKIEDVVDAKEKKVEIDDWLKKRKEERRLEKEEEGEKMDTT